MTVKFRNYNVKEDFKLVGDFLDNVFNKGDILNTWFRARWEYMHHHGWLFESGLDKKLDKIGIWEDEGEIVAVAHFELSLGDVYFEVHPHYSYLKEEILEYAEKNLFGTKDNGSKAIRTFIHQNDEEFKDLAKAKGYKKHEKAFESMSVFNISNDFPVINLPEDFKFKSLEDENNLRKVNRILWRGFDHEGEAPEEDIESRGLMQKAPMFRKDLNIVVESPDENFVSYCGMWYDDINKTGYVEPVATDPDFRKMGLGKAVVLEGIRRCKELGAKEAYVATGKEFYQRIGFKKIFDVNIWVKELK